MVKKTSATTSEELPSIMVEVARTQLAAVTAALKFWGGWVESADKYAKKVSAELEKVSGAGAVPEGLVGQITDYSREYLREIVTLPTVAIEHFASELEKISKPAAKRTRKARAKE
jgi:hypothetical protein